MNKNPFVPQASYPHPPPLPPGPPPQQPQQADYSAYWAAAAAAQQGQQHQAVPAYNQPWTAPQPGARPGEQHALYANYGYGNQQNNQWQRPQHQQIYAQPPPPAAQPPPPPTAQAAYTPYQPAPAFHQQYVPIPQPQPIPVPVPYAAPAPQVQPQPYMQRPPGPMHHSPQHPPQPMSQPSHHNQQQHPAKRQRFDPPVHNQPMGMRQPPGPQSQFQPPSGPSAQFGRGGSIPSGPSGRGGRGGGGMGGMGGIVRGVPLGPARGGMNNRGGGRGGGQFQGSPVGRNGGGGSLRGQSSRGNLGGGGSRDQGRRLGGSGGSFSKGSGGSFTHNRGRNQGHNAGRAVRQDHSNSSLGQRESNASASFSGGKKEENKRTLTDFKLVGLELPEMGWSWGSVPVKAETGDEGGPKMEHHDGASAVAAEGGGGDTPDEGTVGIKTEPTSQETLPPSAPSSPTKVTAPAKESSAPSRLRIYFHTPVSHDDAHPIPHTGDMPADSRKGKRKKLDDDDNEMDERRTRPPPQLTNGEDRDVSVAPSVATEVASEGDWLMAAITEGDGDHERGHDDDVEEEPLHIGADGEGDEHELVATQPAYSDDEEAEGNLVHDAHDVIETLEFHAEGELDASRDLSGNSEMQMTDAPTVADVSDAKLEHASGGQDGAATPPRASQTISSSVSAVAVDPDTNVSSPHHSDTQAPPKEAPTSLDSPTISNEPSSSNAPSTTTTLVDVGIKEEASSSEQQDHLPEPPASPASASNHGESLPRQSGPSSGPKQPSANRLSISYANGNRRLVIDAEVVHSIKVFRTEGRVEVTMTVEKVDDDDKNGLKGFLIEQLSDKSYIPVEILSSEDGNDTTLPAFSKLTLPTELNLVVHLDTAKPLSEPKWVKSGDVQDWLKTMFGRMFWVAGDAAESGWEKRIQVMDPDPPPTLHTVMEGWANNSPVGQPTERHRFLKTHMSEIDNVLEILLRLVRGERATAFLQNAPTISGQSLTGPLLSALSPGSAHGGQQTHVSLAVLAIFRMASEYATKTNGEKGQTEAEERASEIIRCLPTHLLYKSLDGMFKEWRVDKRGR